MIHLGCCTLEYSYIFENISAKFIGNADKIFTFVSFTDQKIDNSHPKKLELLRKFCPTPHMELPCENVCVSPSASTDLS